MQQAQRLQPASFHCTVTSLPGQRSSHRWFSTKPKEKTDGDQKQTTNLKSMYNFHDNKRREIVFPLWARGVTFATVLYLIYFSYNDNEESKEIEEEITRYNEMNEKTPMGGEWILLDEDGEETNSREFAGQWQLIYFGFSHCPDICPEEMNKMRAVIEDLDKKREATLKDRRPMPRVQPIFITLDPERDSPKVIKKYLEDFKIPRIKGFTANTLDEIKKVSKQFHVYFGFGERDENDDYVVDHTIIMYLVNSEGKFVNYYSRALDAEPIVRSIERHIKLWEKISGPMGKTLY